MQKIQQDNIRLQNQSPKEKHKNLQLFRHQNYSFRILTKNEKEEGLKLLLQEFRDQQPLINSYKKLFPQQKQKAQNLVNELWIQTFQNFIINKISVCIVDLETNHVIGISGAIDFNFQIQNFDERFMRNRNYVSSVLNLTSEMIQALKPQQKALLNQKGKVMDVYAVALRKQHMGKKLLHKMIMANQMLAIEQGFQHSFVFSTNFKTGVALSKLQYEKISEIASNKFQYEGFQPFSMLDQLQSQSSLWLKKLS